MASSPGGKNSKETETGLRVMKFLMADIWLRDGETNALRVACWRQILTRTADVLACLHSIQAQGRFERAEARQDRLENHADPVQGWSHQLARPGRTDRPLADSHAAAD